MAKKGEHRITLGLFALLQKQELRHPKK